MYLVACYQILVALMDVSRTVVEESIGAWENVGAHLPFWKEKRRDNAHMLVNTMGHVPVDSMDYYSTRSKDPKFNQHCPVLLIWDMRYKVLTYERSKYLYTCKSVYK